MAGETDGVAIRRIRLGMVGGGRDAFIGAVHRMAARLDDRYEVVAGALSSSPERSVESGLAIGLAADRAYGSWEAMIDGELARPEDERVEAVSIVTPNHLHAPVALACLEAGFHVICDKPLVTTVEDAERLAEAVERTGRVFTVTYNYSGYPMVRQARAMVAEGSIGAIRKVVVEYHQGWLATPLEGSGHKQASWRTDPSRTGVGGATGDIGTHCEQLVATITGRPIRSVCADLTAFVDGRPVDDDANVLIRLEGGAKGLLSCSQVCPGGLNDLRIRVWGERGGLCWHQEDPNRLVAWDLDGTERVLHRGVSMDPAVGATVRLPPGHPEAFIEAFATIYAGAADAMLGRPVEPGAFPGIDDGVRGVRFVHAAVRSSAEGQVWVEV